MVSQNKRGEIIQNIISSANLSVMDSIPKHISDTLIPVIDVGSANRQPNFPTPRPAYSQNSNSRNTNVNLPSQTIVTQSSAKSGTAVTAGTGATLYTVTTGKIFYVTSIILGNNGSNTILEMRDNGASGSLKLSSFLVSANNSIAFTFPTPISFSTNVFVDISASSTLVWALNGWEE